MTKAIHASLPRLPHALAAPFLICCFVLANFILINHASQASAQNPKPVENRPPSVSLSATTAQSGGAAFDGERALAHVRKMVEMGPRPAGSKELAKTRAYIVDELKSYGLEVSTDEFRAKTPVGERRMANVTATLAGETAETIIVASHYDTKPFKEFRFVGANDGGSSTGALLELARVLSAATRKPRFTYWFVFFDGEEAFCRQWDDCSKPNAPDNTYGSRRFVAQLRERGELKRVRAMILLDMIGYKKLELPRDTSSTAWLVETIWRTARALGHGAQFVEREEGIGGDDHEPFMRAGIEAVDIIQLNSYPHWHTPEDTLDKISPQSLKIVGDVLLSSLPHIEGHLTKQSLSQQR
jgi:Zn-dependent M28 family amino/carboxypeptidase